MAINKQVQKTKSALAASPMAARKYVNSGLKDLNLKPAQKIELFNKLVPIVARQIGAERGRAVGRAENITARTAAKKAKAAEKKVIGGK
jgi:hypothetical protein